MPDFWKSFSWQTAQEILADLITDHWLKLLVGVVLAAGGALLAKWKQSRDYSRRQFMERTNLSLNFIEGGVLRIRTLFEVNLSQIVFNDSAQALVLNAASRTTKADPFLQLSQTHDQWFMNNSVLNEISERFLDGYVAHDAGLPTASVPYVLGVTCERDGDVRVQKLRIMLIREQLLQSIVEGKVASPGFERPHHHVRWKTLQQMATLYQQQQASANPDEGRLMRAEIRLRLTASPSLPEGREPLAKAAATGTAKVAVTGASVAAGDATDGARG